MESFNFHDIRVEKANAISRYRRIQRITTLFRFVELFVFLIVVSRFSTQFALSLRLSGEYFRQISMAIISPRFVFLVGNAIVIALFLKSGRFSGGEGEKVADFYEYVEKCRKNQQACSSKEEKKASDAHKSHGVRHVEKTMQRSNSEILDRSAQANGRRRKLGRSMTEDCREIQDPERKTATAGSYSHTEEEMSNEEFRRTVEAFIARQQKALREEEGFSTAVSLIES
ncbi:UNVERIFIED_CONTAM: hypothetical protein Sangu_1070100 [Sesamum angustifolium]|uniref:DUF4408 domain-containing protein n=1 Tax=Sesamum angustifolium TaxID=2727405 RepID=A0AAW2NYS7_9LAMI